MQRSFHRRQRLRHLSNGLELWNGKTKMRVCKTLAAGLYTIQVVDGGYAGTGTFQID